MMSGVAISQGATDAPTPAEIAKRAAVGSQMYGGTNNAQWNAATNNFGSKQIGRIRTNFVNGPEIQTTGLDLFVKYDTDYANGTLSAGLEANWILKYSVDSYVKNGQTLAGAYECAGYFNINNTCRSMPELKAKAFVNYISGKHNFYGALNHINAYDDRRVNTEIQAHTTLDANYTYSFTDQVSLTFSAYNLTDELPPLVFFDMSYDPTTHSPLGRFLKVGFTYMMD